MRTFKGGSELRLDAECLRQLIEYALNEKLFNFSMRAHKVTKVSLHPGNTYVARVSICRADSGGQSHE